MRIGRAGRPLPDRQTVRPLFRFRLTHEFYERTLMKSLALINAKDIETILMALNDAISDMNIELRNLPSEKKKGEILEYKSKYMRVFEKLKQNPSIYALAEHEVDIAAGGLNDAIELLEENMTDDLDDQEKSEIIVYKNECERLVDILAS